MKEQIIQFGTGNFLRAFADEFVDTMNKKGLLDAGIVTVQSTDSQTGKTINSQNGKYHILVRGIKDGKKVCELTEISSISRCINANEEFGKVCELAHNPDIKIIISNTTEAGICFDPSCKFDSAVVKSFPAKITKLMYGRFKCGYDGFTVICCELIDNNAQLLKKYVLEYARLWNLEDEFSQWVEEKNSFHNSLVDRIVSGFPKDEYSRICSEYNIDDKLLDVAEPYHFWAIEGNLENILPLNEADINAVWTNDITPYKKRKVRLLNATHTLLVFPSMLMGIECVKESMGNPLLRSFADECMYSYTIKTLSDTAETREYIKSVIERFENPYISHRWQSISLNSVSKFKSRVLPIIYDLISLGEKVPMHFSFSLACLIFWYKTREASDEKENIEIIKSGTLDEILRDSRFWGKSLEFLSEDVEKCYKKLEQTDAQETLKWIMSL